MELPAKTEGSYEGVLASARMAPVCGSSAATAPFLEPSPLKAALWAAPSRVVTTFPPVFLSPVNIDRVRSKNSWSLLPVRMPSSMDSSCEESKACEE